MLSSNPLYLIMQKKNSAIKFEPSNLFYLTRQTPIETLLGWVQTLSTL